MRAFALVIVLAACSSSSTNDSLVDSGNPDAGAGGADASAGGAGGTSGSGAVGGSPTGGAAGVGNASGAAGAGGSVPECDAPTGVACIDCCKTAIPRAHEAFVKAVLYTQCNGLCDPQCKTECTTGATSLSTGCAACITEPDHDFYMDVAAYCRIETDSLCLQFTACLEGCLN